MPSPPREGRVLRIEAKVCHIDVDGVRHALPLAGKLFEQRSHEKRPLAVGDRVLVRVGEDGGAGDAAIDAVLPRTSQLTRRSASEGEERAQVIAANVTLVLVVAALAEPPLQPEVVDGVLAAAAREHIQAALVLTKADRDRTGKGAGYAELYRRLGYRVFVTSITEGHVTTDVLAELATMLHQNITVLCGLSGVGKSTLLNHVIPGLGLRVGSLNHIRQGRHTTSTTELIPLPGGGHVLDTPGVRSFHLFGTGSQELQFLFPEFRALLPACAYRNCLHQNEPDCAVRAALARGEVAQSRYDSYLRMLATAMAAENKDPTARDSRRGGTPGRRSRPS